jgi:hypothetical protein
MKKRLILLSLAVLAAATVVVPLAASGGEPNKLVIGVRVTFTSPTHASGTFASCCAVNDKGAAEADVTSFTAKKNDTATFEATETFVGSNGTFALALRGVTGPLSSPRHIAQGTGR